MFRFVIRAARRGSSIEILCCYLEVEPFAGWCGPTRSCPATGRRRQGFFTAVMTLEPRGERPCARPWRCIATKHDRNQHAEMGFHDGWGTVLDQLVAYAPTI